MSNGSVGCTSSPLAEPAEPVRESKSEAETEAAAVCRSRPSWSQPQQFGLRGCLAASDQVQVSSSTAVTTTAHYQLFLQQQQNHLPLRRRVLVRSRSDATAYETAAVSLSHSHVNRVDPAGKVTANGSDQAAAGRRGTLDRLHRFRFGGNRGNVRSKKTSAEDKADRLRELTDRLKSTSSSSPTSSQKHAAQQQLQQPPHQHQPTSGVDGSSTASVAAALGPVPPPRTRHGSHASQHPLSTPHHQQQQYTQTPTSTCSPPVHVAVEPAPPPPPLPPPPLPNNSDALAYVNLRLPKPEARPIVGSYIQRTIPFRSASFSQVDFSSSDGKYFRRRNADSGVLSSESISGAALTLPRKKENQSKRSSGSSTPSQQRPTCALTDVNKDTNLAHCESGTCTTLATDLTPADSPHSARVLVSDTPTDCVGGSGSGTNTVEERKRDRSRRRKGMYISQWPDQRASVMLAYAHEEEMPPMTGEVVRTLNPKLEECRIEVSRNSVDEPTTPEDVSKRIEWDMRPVLTAQSSEEKDVTQTVTVPQRQTCKQNNFCRTDSFSEGEGEHLERRAPTPNREHPTSPVLSPSDLSDTESRASLGNDSLSPHAPRCYSKRPLRGPYGQMLEAEMKRPDASKTFSKHQYGSDLKFLDDFSKRSSNPNMVASMMSLPSANSVNLADSKPKFVIRSRGASNHSLDDSHLKNNMNVRHVPMINSSSRKVSADVSSSVPTSGFGVGELEPAHQRLLVCHQRTTSSPSKLEEITLPNQHERATSAEPSTDFLRELLRGSSERLTVATVAESGPGAVPGSLIPDDTRTHIVVELYETERSYVESLQILVMKYLEPLKSTENSCLLDATLVDEIFYQVPSLLTHHQGFLDELRKRLEHWDMKQKIGDVFLDFTKPAVVETYTAFINNWKRAKEVIKTTSQAKPAFARFLEAMAREHKGKLALDSLLIKPIQKFPKYELLIQRLIKHTDSSHPDYSLLLEAQKEIHENLIKINCTERETVEFEQQQQNLKELESLVEGLVNLVTADRSYLRHDLVTMTTGQGTRKERALLLFSDLLVITSIKRRSGTIRKPSGTCPGSVASTLDANKYKLLMRIPLEDLEIMKAKDENVRRVMLEIENLTEDIAVLNQISELTWSLHCPRIQLEDIVREMLSSLTRQLTEQQSSDSQLSYLDLTLNTPNGTENLSVVFSQPEKRASWEESFNEAKHKLAMSVDRRPSPEFLAPVPIRKTRAGLQFTCAAPTLTTASNSPRDVWVCNSDGYVGQVCVLSLYPEPTVTSCNGVCNARILCVASIPAAASAGAGACASNLSISCNRGVPRKTVNTVAENDENESRNANIQLDSSSSSADEEDSERDEYIESRRRGTPVNRAKSAETASTDSSDDTDSHQPTMWLGTEDGCIHVYNCNDNIRIKKNKIRLQHGSSILCIMYLDNRVFVSMANGDITIYSRDQAGGWNTSSPLTVSVGSAMMPVSRMLPNNGKLWCSCSNTIKIFSIHSRTVEHTFQTNGDQNKSITCMVMSGLGVWLSLHNSALIKCFHSVNYEFLCEVNVAPAVTKMLTSCDDIIRQHKAACLRVTSLLACKDLLWIGTSAGVLLTMPLPHITTSTMKLAIVPTITGVPHGHTGHVRFLTSMESGANSSGSGSDATQQQFNYGGMSEPSNNSKLLVISGGDGYEDFRSSNMSEVAGREDSTNHLLLWHV